MLRVHLMTADQRARNCCYPWKHFQIQFDLNSYNLFSLLISVSPNVQATFPTPALKGATREWSSLRLRSEVGGRYLQLIKLPVPEIPRRILKDETCFQNPGRAGGRGSGRERDCRKRNKKRRKAGGIFRSWGCLGAAWIF